MDKVKERLLAMLGTGAGLGEVTQLMATCGCQSPTKQEMADALGAARGVRCQCEV